jgi:hypothetical protein
LVSSSGVVVPVPGVVAAVVPVPVDDEPVLVVVLVVALVLVVTVLLVGPDGVVVLKLPVWETVVVVTGHAAELADAAPGARKDITAPDLKDRDELACKRSLQNEQRLDHTLGLLDNGEVGLDGNAVRSSGLGEQHDCIRARGSLLSPLLSVRP